MYIFISFRTLEGILESAVAPAGW